MDLPTLTPKIAIQTFILLTCIKWLLVPSYHSTDFDVHRLWLAITRHLPLSEWYYYDANGTTPHTLDYPPLFAFFEYALSNNFITNALLKRSSVQDYDGSSVSSSWLDEECLALSYEVTTDNAILKVSENCIRFQRGTVIFSDLVLFVGAYMASKAMQSTITTTTVGMKTPLSEVVAVTSSSSSSSSWVAFTLIVTNPGLLMLDHVHFQYNGMLLGVLLISIACVVRGAKAHQNTQKKHQQEDRACEMDGVSPNYDSNGGHNQQYWELLAAASFAALLALKHLYLTLAPLYFFYLLRRYCFVNVYDEDEKERVSVYSSTNDNKQNKRKRDNNEVNASGSLVRFSWRRLLIIGVVSSGCFLGPFVPFIIYTDARLQQMCQILKRLFPFGRGLVHDYWAANVWALYLFISRCLTFIAQKSTIQKFLPLTVCEILSSICPFQEPKPQLVALLLLIGLWPGGISMAWKIGNRSIVNGQSDSRGNMFIYAMVFCSLSSFMLGYHVHEKAILTAIIPMTLIATNSRRAESLYIRTCSFGLFGIFPLLYRPEELPMKVVLFVTWMCGAIHVLKINKQGMHLHVDKDVNSSTRMETVPEYDNIRKVDVFSFAMIGSLLLYMDVVHPIALLPSGKLEFLPLMATSIICGIGLFWCWLESYCQMKLTVECLK